MIKEADIQWLDFMPAVGWVAENNEFGYHLMQFHYTNNLNSIVFLMKIKRLNLVQINGNKTIVFS